MEDDLVPHAVVEMVVNGSTPIKAWREHLGLTQADVAARLDISQSAFAQIEAARPRKQTRARVAAALGLSEEQLNF